MSAGERVRWGLVRGWARLGGVVKLRWGRDLPGLGFALRRVRSPRPLEVEGRWLWFDPAVALAYDRLVTGRWLERETHALLKAVLDGVPGPVHFADVGASIGAMVMDVAGHPNAGRVWAFEPHPASAAACRRAAELNGFDNVLVVQKALTDGAPARMRFDAGAPTGSALDPLGEPVPSGTLDEELAELQGPLVVLVDVEGAEPAVLRGGSGIIGRLRPLVVFEYNDVSRARYRLDEARAALGAGYRVVRLRMDGRLDGRTEEAWNCVAVPEGSPFEAVCEGLMMGTGGG